MGRQGLLFLLFQPAFCDLYWEEENKLFPFQSCYTDRSPLVLEQAPKMLGVVVVAHYCDVMTKIHVTPKNELLPGEQPKNEISFVPSRSCYNCILNTETLAKDASRECASRDAVKSEDRQKCDDSSDKRIGTRRCSLKSC